MLFINNSVLICSVKLEIKEIQSKSILIKSKLPDADYVLNPYTGCSFGCIYCYASFMSRYVGKQIEDWGNFVYVKANAPDLLVKEMPKISPNLKILLSSVTDPYQSIEAKYKITQKCLQFFADQNATQKISILTKSPLVTRDINILKDIKNTEVGLTITTTDDDISRYFEKNAPDASARLKALTELNKAGIKTYAFVGPLLPHYVESDKNLDDLFKQIKSTGTTDLYIEHINLRKYILNRLKNEAKDINEQTLEKYYQSQSKEYMKNLNQKIEKLVKKYNFNLRLGSAIYHNK